MFIRVILTESFWRRMWFHTTSSSALTCPSPFILIENTTLIWVSWRYNNEFNLYYLKTLPDIFEKYVVKYVQIPTGSMLGLIRNDQVEVYHILRPSVRASGRVVSANQLDCTVEVVEEKKKLAETLDAIYQVDWLLLGCLCPIHCTILFLYFYWRMKNFVQKTGQPNVFVWWRNSLCIRDFQCLLKD